ncbi:MAG: Gfo/Idh/MocA family oxidoreductase [Bacteroidetes bacterium]|nr:Gfo/Idh/MocA family oxidoreductase [Bacteroidota bacterium]
MSAFHLPIIVHGATGRMGHNQHLRNSLMAIIADGGVALPNGDRILPQPILLGRNEEKLQQLAQEFGIEQISTDYDAALSGEAPVFFDSGTTAMRSGLLQRAMQAGKHVYCEKPMATTLPEALLLCEQAKKNGVKNGIVMDKLFLPGLLKLRSLVDQGFFGRILSVKIDFGYWVFTGHDPAQPAQRPSWNYQQNRGGGIVFDMMCHWRYVIDQLISPVESVSCLHANIIKERVDESGRAYPADADDAFYAMLRLRSGAIAQISSSWCTRVDRDDLVTFQIDGTLGSAVAGLTRCKVQPLALTPRPTWNPDSPSNTDFAAQWEPYLPHQTYINGFRAQWEMFIAHLYGFGDYCYTFKEGVKGVQLAEAALASARDRKWVDLSNQS